MVNMDVKLVAAAAIVYVALKKEKETKEETRNMDKPMAIYNTLLEELRTERLGDYKKNLRMSEENFNDILCKIEVDIRKQGVVMRNAISSAVKLAGFRSYFYTLRRMCSIAILQLGKNL